MAMPKKGTRKIVVSGKTYKYMIKRKKIAVQMTLSCLINNRLFDNPAIILLTVELDDNKYITRDFEESITPKMVEEFIKENI